jgi:predicted ATPase
MHLVDEGLNRARQLQHVYTLGFSLLFKCWASAIIDATDEIPRHSDEMFNLGNEHGFPLWTGYALAFRGLCSTADDRASDGVQQITEGLAHLRPTGAVASYPLFLAFLGRAFLKLGQPAEGLSRLHEAAQLIETTDERYYEAEVHRVRGDLLRITDQHAEAEESYRKALKVAERQNAKAHQLRAATSMARLWRDQGERDEARELLAPVYSWFTEGFDTRDLKEAKTLFDELAS